MLWQVINNTTKGNRILCPGFLLTPKRTSKTSKIVGVIAVSKEHTSKIEGQDMSKLMHPLFGLLCLSCPLCYSYIDDRSMQSRDQSMLSVIFAE